MNTDQVRSPRVTLIHIDGEPKATHRRTHLHGWSHAPGTAIDVEVDGEWAPFVVHGVDNATVHVAPPGVAIDSSRFTDAHMTPTDFASPAAALGTAVYVQLVDAKRHTPIAVVGDITCDCGQTFALHLLVKAKTAPADSPLAWTFELTQPEGITVSAEYAALGVNLRIACTRK